MNRTYTSKSVGLWYDYYKGVEMTLIESVVLPELVWIVSQRLGCYVVISSLVFTGHKVVCVPSHCVNPS